MSGTNRGISAKTLGLVLLLIALAMPAAGETWSSVMLLDVMCSKLPRVMKKPTDHPRACILECHDEGYGVVLPDGSFLAFDEKGNKLAIDVLRDDKAPEENVRVDVVGTRKGETIQVDRLALVN